LTRSKLVPNSSVPQICPKGDANREYLSSYIPGVTHLECRAQPRCTVMKLDADGGGGGVRYVDGGSSCLWGWLWWWLWEWLKEPRRVPGRWRCGVDCSLETSTEKS